MKGEINRDFYCLCLTYQGLDNYCFRFKNKCHSKCDNYCRKYPTPEQYKKEYREEWTGAVYVNAWRESGDSVFNDGWQVYHNVKKVEAKMDRAIRIYPAVTYAVVCACTPG